MAKQEKDGFSFRVHFEGLNEGERAPNLALYAVDASGRATKPIGAMDKGTLVADAGIERQRVFALGPAVEDPATLSSANLVLYRADVLASWRKDGLLLPKDIWPCFHLQIVCTSGDAKKCRPWWWDLIAADLQIASLEPFQRARFEPLNASLNPHLFFPQFCLPLCDGIVEVYERYCCCPWIDISGLLDRLREILGRVPIPIPDPNPDPWLPVTPGGPGPGPGPGPDPAPFARAPGLRTLTPRSAKTRIKALQLQSMEIDYAKLPPRRLYDDYAQLIGLSPSQQQEYVAARPYLLCLICSCSTRKVGETALQPCGHFEFCYWRPGCLPLPHCYTSFAYRIKQLIGGVWTVVYDGVAAGDYFPSGASAEVHTYNPRALVCAEGCGDPPPNDGNAFVMLEYVGSPGTHHFNFPAQNGVSQVGGLLPSSGAFTTSYAVDCPWGAGLGLRLWVSPELEGTVAYYRIKAVPVADTGIPSGPAVVLDANVTWSKFDNNFNVIGELLGPNTVGGNAGLFTVPYWKSPDHRYLTGQYHQVWDTTKFGNGRHLLVVELFDAAGHLIKPNSAPGGEPGTANAFQFRRWDSATTTQGVSHADLAHVFWLDNLAVGGDLVDLRHNGLPNTAECQFIVGPQTDTFAIGFRAYHVNGVSNADSFMSSYYIWWQRGLNGPTGTLTPAPGPYTTDQGEPPAPPATSNSATFGTLLTDNTTMPPSLKPKCTFSVHLSVYAKHFNGSSRLSGYDYYETASFAVELTP